MMPDRKFHELFPEPRDYLRRVQAIIAHKGEDSALADHELMTVAAGYVYAVGPNDCALQIIDDRDDALDHRVMLRAAAGGST